MRNEFAFWRWPAQHRSVAAVCIAIWSLLFYFGQPANGQALSGINGTVTDSTGGVVANAKVTATNNATQVSKTAVTSSAGTYTITDLIPGSYTVKVDLTGFQSSVHSGVGVEVGRNSTVDAMLQPGSTEQTVTVAENAIALDTTAPSLNTTIENKVVQELPTQIAGGRGRQIDNFIFLAPGVTGSTFSHRINLTAVLILRTRSFSTAFRWHSLKHRDIRPSGILPLNW
jgi:hypothetical protein